MGLFSFKGVGGRTAAILLSGAKPEELCAASLVCCACVRQPRHFVVRVLGLGLVSSGRATARGPPHARRCASRSSRRSTCAASWSCWRATCCARAWRRVRARSRWQCSAPLAGQVRALLSCRNSCVSQHACQRLLAARMLRMQAQLHSSWSSCQRALRAVSASVEVRVPESQRIPGPSCVHSLVCLSVGHLTEHTFPTLHAVR